MNTFSTPPIPLRQLKARYAAWVVDQLGGHKAAAARFLRIQRVTLDNLLKEAEHPLAPVDKIDADLVINQWLRQEQA